MPTIYDRVLLISLDALSHQYIKYFSDYFTTNYINYHTTDTWTLPSHFAMLTGCVLSKYYHQFPLRKKQCDFTSSLPKTSTIATYFRNVGFKTRAFTGGGYMSKSMGWGHDWDRWEEANTTNEEWRGERLLPEKKEFVFLHTYYLHNWFDEDEKVQKLFWKYLENFIQKDNKESKLRKLIVNKGKKYYLKRVLELSRKLEWIKLLPKDTLVILTSDHAELFTDRRRNYLHADCSLENEDIFRVPLLIKENLPRKRIIKDNFYSTYLCRLICDKTGISFKEPIDVYEEKQKSLNAELVNTSNLLNKSVSEKNILKQELDVIKSSKFFRLWRIYCQLRDKILGN